MEGKQDLIPAHRGRKGRGGEKNEVRRTAAFMMPCRTTARALPLINPKARTPETGMSPPWISLMLKTNTPVICHQKPLTMQGGRNRSAGQRHSKQVISEFEHSNSLKHSTPPKHQNRRAQREREVPTVHQASSQGMQAQSTVPTGEGLSWPCTCDPARVRNPAFTLSHHLSPIVYVG